MDKDKLHSRDDSGHEPAIPLGEEDGDERPPLTPIQQAAYSAAIFAEPSSD